jgi:hypothetical protein
MFKPMGSSVTHVKELRQQQLAMASQIIEKLAPVAMSGPQPFMIDWYEAGVSSLESLDIKNIDQILVKLEPPQAQQMMQQSEMKQLQQVKYGEEITQGTKAKYEAMLQDNQAKNDIILEKVKADVAPRPQKASKK